MEDPSSLQNKVLTLMKKIGKEKEVNSNEINNTKLMTKQTKNNFQSTGKTFIQSYLLFN